MKSIVNIIKEEIENMSGVVQLQRCQAGEVNDVWDFNVVNGQNGEGIYAFLAGDRGMKDYYCKNGENFHSFKIEKKYIKDLSKLNLDYWKVKEFIYNNPQYKAFIFRHTGPGIPSSREVLITDPEIIVLDNSNVMTEEYNHADYLKWKRQNVTIRGIRDNNNSAENGGMAKYGQGLYTAFLGNKDLAKQYGKVYFLVNAIPKHPKIVYSTNDAEIFEQQMVTNFCKMHGVPRSNEFFSSKTTIADEMQRLGYDGLVIKGREMVNYTPPSNVLYFSTEQELKNYYDVVISKNSK